MRTNYGKIYSTRATPQSQAIPGSKQVVNSAGGYAWAVDDWCRLDRFLILGTEGGSYYASQRSLTIENADAVVNCIAEDGVRTVDRIVEIWDNRIEALDNIFRLWGCDDIHVVSSFWEEGEQAGYLFYKRLF